MTPPGITARICDVIVGVLGAAQSSLSDASGQETITGWDSLAHIHVIMGLEAEFDVSFDPERAVQLTTISAIRDALVECGVRAE